MTDDCRLTLATLLTVKLSTLILFHFQKDEFHSTSHKLKYISLSTNQIKTVTNFYRRLWLDKGIVNN